MAERHAQGATQEQRSVANPYSEVPALRAELRA